MAADKPFNWGLCPTVDPLPGFDGAPAADPKAAEMRQQLPTDIEGDQLSGTSTTPQYQGNVALKRGDQFLGADNLRMDTETGNYIAEGNVRYQDTSFRMVADRAEGNQDTDTHKVTNIRYQLVERRGNGDAESVDLQGQVGQMHRSTYTTCDPSQPIWRVRAPEIDVDNGEGFGTARNAVLQIGNVPVLYFPWFKFPIDDRRQTGLLFPQFGLSRRNGFDYLQPIYLNLAPNYDATLLPRYMSKRGFMFGTEFRYLYEGGRGEVTGNYLPNDKLRDKDRGSVFYSGYHNVNSNWQARSSISWVSDTRYVEDFTSRLNGMGSASSLQSTVGIYGTGETWTAGLMAERWQLTDYTLDERSLPYNRQPRAYFNWENRSAFSRRASTPKQCVSPMTTPTSSSLQAPAFQAKQTTATITTNTSAPTSATRNTAAVRAWISSRMSRCHCPAQPGSLLQRWPGATPRISWIRRWPRPGR